MGTTTQEHDPVGATGYSEPAGEFSPAPGREPENDPTRPPASRLRGAVVCAAGVVVVVAAVAFLRHDTGVTSLPPAPAPRPPAAASPASMADSPAENPDDSATFPGSPANGPAGTTTALTTVTVLNNSRTTGLANQTAGVLRKQGWAVATIGNYTGRVPGTTVFYPAGEEAAAHALGDAFPAVQQVLPRFEGLPGDGLSLVVTGDFAPPG